MGKYDFLEQVVFRYAGDPAGWMSYADHPPQENCYAWGWVVVEDTIGRMMMLLMVGGKAHFVDRTPMEDSRMKVTHYIPISAPLSPPREWKETVDELWMRKKEE